MLLGLLELAGNHVLGFDPDTQQKLDKLQDKTIALAIKTPPITLFLTPTRDGIEIAMAESNHNSDQPKHADVTLKTSLSALIKISKDGLEDAELQPGELEISGDAIIGQRFASIIANLNIDWEELLAQQIGDSPARAVSLAGDKLSSLLKDTGDNVKQTVSDLLNDEMQITADKNTLGSFLDDVDTLRADAERLATRIKRLQQSIDSEN